ncbi:hypothetical protein MMC16_001258 [Acarospora aff. strigata]|nr:hypothetical protein [Acarospora aff. strigata]
MQPILALTSTTTTPQKDPITCHVLDTTTGHPAVNLHVSLTLLKPLGLSTPFTALTNADGRVTTWDAQAGPGLHEICSNSSEHGDSGGSSKGEGGGEGEGESENKGEAGNMVWSLRFDSGGYFGEGRTFWPEVEVRFFVTRGERYHVPVLLGPWSYTTYRGS